MFVSGKLEGPGTTEEITVSFTQVAGISVDCSGDFVGTVKIKRRLLQGSMGKTIKEVTASAEIVRQEVPGAIIYAEIESGDISAGFAVVEMRT